MGGVVRHELVPFAHQNWLAACAVGAGDSVCVVVRAFSRGRAAPAPHSIRRYAGRLALGKSLAANELRKSSSLPTTTATSNLPTPARSAPSSRWRATCCSRRRRCCQLPQAVDIPLCTTDAEFIHLNSAPSAFPAARPPPPDIDCLMRPLGIACVELRGRSQSAVANDRQFDPSHSTGLRIRTMTFRPDEHSTSVEQAAAALRHRQRRDGEGCRPPPSTASSRNHGDGAQPDRKAPDGSVATPVARRPTLPAATANARHSRNRRRLLPRLSRACFPSSPTSSQPSPWCRTRKSAARAPPSSAISCSPNPALPAPPSRRALRAGRSSGVSTSTASASSKTAPALAAPPISAKTISCRSTRWRPIRSRLCAVPRHCATDRPRSAASSARPTTASRMPCPHARPHRSRVLDCRRRRRWQTWKRLPA